VWLGHRPRLPLSPMVRAERCGVPSGFASRPRMEGPGQRQVSPRASFAKWRSERAGLALLVIGCGDFHLIACLLQSAYMLLIRSGLHARWRRVHLEGVRDKLKVLVQQCANLGIACSDQRKISLFLGFCHTGLLKGDVIINTFAKICEL